MNRKRIFSKKKNLDDSINLIPMINLIFLLLIFFLLTGVIQKKEVVDVSIPESFFGKKKNELKETLTIKKDGKSLSVEFAIKHPTGLYLPIDSHWPKTSYERLLELRKVETTEEIEQQRINKEKEDLFKKIINDYRDKAKEVNKKYVDSSISAGFACIYIPAEGLYHEVTTHVNEEKELWISKVQEATKVTFMGPSTFSAYCSAILLGFNQIEGDQKAKMFVKHLEALTNSIDQLNEATSKHENNLKKAYTDAQAVTSSAEKMKTKMQRVKEELNNLENKE